MEIRRLGAEGEEWQSMQRELGRGREEVAAEAVAAAPIPNCHPSLTHPLPCA